MKEAWELDFYWREREPVELYVVTGYEHRVFVFYSEALAIEWIEAARRDEMPRQDMFLELCKLALSDNRVAALPDDSPPWLFNKRTRQWRPVAPPAEAGGEP